MTTNSDLLSRIQSRLESHETHFRMSDALLLKEAAEAIERYEGALQFYSCDCDEKYPHGIQECNGDHGAAYCGWTARQALQPGKVKAE